MDELRDKLQDFIDDIRDLFSKDGLKKLKAKSSSFSMDDLIEFAEQKGNILLIILVLCVAWMFYGLWQLYIPYKTDMLNIEIQKANIKVLEVAKANKQKNEEKFKAISDEIITPKKFNIADLACFFMKFDKNYVGYVNPDYKIQTLTLDEDQQTFEVTLSGIKYYKSITDILVLLKQYKTLVDVDSYNISITPEESNWPRVEYYKVVINGKLVQNELPSPDWALEEKEE